MVNKKFLFLFLLIMVITPFVASQPPVANVQNPNMDIVAIVPSIHEEGVDFTYHAHAINLTSPVQSFLTNETTTCYLHLYNLAAGGNHFIESQMGFDDNGFDFEYTVLGGNYSEGMLVESSILCNTSVMADQTTSETKITSTNKIISLSQTFVYLGFLLLIFLLAVYSFNLIIANPITKDGLSLTEKNNLMKKSKFLLYAYLIKQKLWILGSFGVYICLLLFTALATEFVYYSDISSLNTIFSNAFIVLAWLGIPFVIFWMAYIIIYFSKNVKEILEAQYGGFRNGR